MSLNHNLHEVAQRFEFRGEILSTELYNSGHINDTYCVVLDHKGVRSRCVLQRINHQVFRNPVALMENIQRVTSHLERKLTDGSPENGQSLTLIPTRNGAACTCDTQGNYWRAYRFIEQARTYDVVDSPRQAFEVAKAFGRFQRLLSDLPAPRLHDTIPDFHNTPKRFAALKKAIAEDAANRAIEAKAEIEFALRHQAMTTVLLDACLPERVTHNDTKLNNVMLDDTTGEGVCVIDLDTVMPGLALYDFGDMVRTSTSPAQEDERDLSKVTMQFPMFEALARGYLESTNGFLTTPEKRFLAFAGKLITFETGVRFLTDFLAGDTYFKVHRNGHNLDRCRTQFRLVESIEEQEDQMAGLIERVSGN